MINYKLIVTGLLTIGSVVGVREYLKPRDIENLLKWKGINLISESENNAWEASFYENEEALKTMQIDSHEKLKNWCLAQMKQGITDELASQAEKYCQDKPTTIMGQIIRDGEKDKFVGESHAEAAQIIYVTSKDRNQLKKVMSIEISEPIESEEKEVFVKIGIKINAWCNAQQKTNVRDAEHLGNVKKYCYDKKVKKVQELLQKQGFELLNDGGKYKERFKKQELNRVSELISDIKQILKSKQKEEEFFENEKIKEEKEGEALKLWCYSKKENALIESKIFSEIYPKVQSRCAIKKD